MPSAGGACPEQGLGKLVIEITGLPEGVEADVLLTGPEQLEISASGTLTGVTAGGYAVTAARVYDADAIVRTVFHATVTTPGFCLPPDGSQAISIIYSEIPSSNKLWNTVNSQGVAAFERGAIGETGSREATVAIKGPTVRGLAFDRDGNLWTLKRSDSGPDIMRFPAASLGSSGELAPDISIPVPDGDCGPAFLTLAFDAAGNLWLSHACRDEVRRIAASQLGTSGEKEADALLSVADPDGLAFDGHGNLWVDVPSGLARFDAARLGRVDADPPDLRLSITTTIHSWQVNPAGFAFDATGNLWGLDVSSSLLFRLTPADLAGTGARTVTAAVAFRVDAAGATTVPAFDDGGGLWVGLSDATPDGAFGRISPEQLAMNGGGLLVPEVQITSASIGWGSTTSLAFFPAPAGLPLFHALPVP
jgi:hypothetical protein